MRTRHGISTKGSIWLQSISLGALVLLMGALAGCALIPVTQATPMSVRTTNTPCWSAVTIESIPAGADIAIDGSDMGMAPIRIALSEGSHQFQAEMDGFASGNVSIDLACGPRLVTLKLEDVSPPTLTLSKAPAQVERGRSFSVTARAEDPSGIAQIVCYLDGDLIQRTDQPVHFVEIDTSHLDSGQHVLRFVAHDATGHQTAQEIVLDVGEPQATATVTPSAVPTLTDLPATVAVATAAPTAMVRSVQPVSAAWAEITVPTYDYEQALYVDKSAGHPYPLLRREQVGGPRPRTYRVIVMRNEYLELTLMPELGGRIYQCRLVPSGEQLLYNNKVIKPTHWGPEDQGWWLAVGGIEFCLPVDEHGYLTAEPWDAAIDRQEDGSVAVTMSNHEKTRDVDAHVAISLAPGQSRFDITSSLTNVSGQTQTLQYWINAMLAPGSDSIEPSLQFYYPADEMIVHSTGDADLPGAGERMAWPVHNGRDLGSYATWRNWLGVFAPHVKAGYTAVYDHHTQLGMIRVFPHEVARGVKLFGFGLGFGDSGAYTDDGSQYIEMWGGWTPTFWNYGNLAAGETLTWSESWYPISNTHGVSAASPKCAAMLDLQKDRVVGTVAATQCGEWRLEVLVDDVVITQQELDVTPQNSTPIDLPIDSGNSSALVTVRIVDEYGKITLQQALGQER